MATKSKSTVAAAEAHYKDGCDNNELFKCWAECFSQARDALKEQGFSDEDAMQLLVAHGCCVDCIPCPA